MSVLLIINCRSYTQILLTKLLRKLDFYILISIIIILNVLNNFIYILHLHFFIIHLYNYKIVFYLFIIYLKIYLLLNLIRFYDFAYYKKLTKIKKLIYKFDVKRTNFMFKLTINVTIIVFVA